MKPPAEPFVALPDAIPVELKKNSQGSVHTDLLAIALTKNDSF